MPRSSTKRPHPSTLDQNDQSEFTQDQDMATSSSPPAASNRTSANSNFTGVGASLHAISTPQSGDAFREHTLRQRQQSREPDLQPPQPVKPLVVPVADDPNSAYYTNVLLAWTATTGDIARRFSVALPARIDVTQGQWIRIPIIPFMQHPTSSVNPNRIKKSRLEQIPNATHRWMVPDTLPTIRDPQQFFPILDQILLEIENHMLRLNTPSARINQILLNAVPEHVLLTERRTFQ